MAWPELSLKLLFIIRRTHKTQRSVCSRAEIRVRPWDMGCSKWVWAGVGGAEKWVSVCKLQKWSRLLGRGNMDAPTWSLLVSARTQKKNWKHCLLGKENELAIFCWSEHWTCSTVVEKESFRLWHRTIFISFFFVNPLLFASCTDTVKLREAWRGVLSSTPPYK
jgi:hypothetical protein